MTVVVVIVGRFYCYLWDLRFLDYRYDVGSHYVFVGDSSGRITLLSINQVNGQVTCRVIRELRGHEQSVSFLAWDSVNSRLFSCSADRSVIFWDIGGAKGSSFELQVSALFSSLA